VGERRNVKTFTANPAGVGVSYIANGLWREMALATPPGPNSGTYNYYKVEPRLLRERGRT